MAKIKDTTDVCYRGTIMLVLTAIVTVLLFVYLMAALLRPEWF